MKAHSSYLLQTSAITAFYHIPPVWVGEIPNDGELERENASNFTKEVYRKELSSRIRVRVRQDGLFIFDFSKWKPGSAIKMPIFTPKNSGKKVDPFSAIEKDMLHVYNRVQAMNAHLACLTTTLLSCQKVVWGIQQIITPSDYLSLHDFDDDSKLPELKLNWSKIHDYIWRRGISGENKLKRIHQYQLHTIEESFNLFDSIITSHTKGILPIINLIYNSAIRYSEHDFTNSLILSWTACEALIKILWRKFIDTELAETINRGTSIANNLINKLRNYDSISNISDMLSIHDITLLDLYDSINKSRRSRNHWLHNLKGVSSKEASKSIVVSQNLLNYIAEIKLNIPIKYSHVGATIIE